MICKDKSTKLNGFKYCCVSLTIQLNISHLFTHSKMIKRFYFKQFNSSQLFALSLMSNHSIWPIDRTPSGATTPSQSGLGCDGNKWGTPHSPNLLTIRFFVSRALIGWRWILPVCRDAVSVFHIPRRHGLKHWISIFSNNNKQMFIFFFSKKSSWYSIYLFQWVFHWSKHF